MQEPDERKKVSKVSFASDFALQVKLRMKLLVRDKITVVAFLTAAIVFALVLNTLNIWAEDKSSIPVGIVDEDETGFSKSLLTHLEQVPSLYVNTGSFEEMEGLLLDGYISCIFVIKDGYEENIKNSNLNGIIGLYSGRDDKTSAILGDIVAGQMLQDICVYKGMLTYSELEDGSYTDEEYMAFVDELKNDPMFNFSFDVSFINVDNLTDESEGIDNSLLYRQMIAGMVAMLLSFVILFAYSQTVIEHEQGITYRRKVTIQSAIAAKAGNIAAVLIVSMILCILVAASTANSVGEAHVFLEILLGSLAYVATVSVILTILSGITKTIAQYQIIGGILLLISGVAGFASVFSGFMSERAAAILQYVPNSMYIKFFTDMLI